MKFQTEMTQVLSDNDDLMGFIDSKPPHVLFVPKLNEYDVNELECILRRMKEMTKNFLE